MTTDVQATSAADLLQLVQNLSPLEKANLVNQLIKDAGLSVVLGNPGSDGILVQIDGLNDAAMADIMHAIAESIRHRSSPGS